MRLLEQPIIKGHRILLEIQQIKNELKSASGIILPSKEIEDKRGRTGCEIGYVVSIGPDAFARKGASEPYCVPGDHVLFVQYAGQVYEHPETKIMYRIVNEEDILAVIGKEE